MASHKIRIQGVADFSQLSSAVVKLSKEVDDAFGKKTKNIIDLDNVEIMKREVGSAFSKMREELKKINKENKELNKQFKDATGDAKKQEAIAKKQLELVKKRIDAEKQLFSLRQAENTLMSGRTPDQVKAEGKAAAKEESERLRKEKKGRASAFNVVAGGAADAVSELPGANIVGSIGSSTMNGAKAAKMAGMSSPEVLAVGALAGAAALAAVAISRMVSGFEVYKHAVPDLLAISGMGAKPMTDGRTVGRAGELGYGQLEVLQTQKQMEKSFGRAASPHEDSNRMINILTASRGLGMEPSEIIGGGNQLRAAGGTETANRQMAMILEKAITSGMDKTQASNFLSAAVGLLTELNQGGAADTAALLSTMSELVSTGRMSPEQAAKSVGGLNSAISGSTGEGNAFFQTSAVRAGLGGGSLLGTNFAVRQGLTGVDQGALSKMVGDTQHGREGMQAVNEMGLTDPAFSQKFAKGILGEIDQRFDRTSKTGRQATLGFVGSMFGAKSAPEAVKALALLEKISKGGTLNGNDKKLLENLGKDPQESWREKTLASLDGTARATAAMQAALEKGQFDLGAASSRIINELTGALVKLDNTITQFLNSDTFASIEDAVRSLGSTLQSVFKDIVDIPENMGKLFDDFMSDPKAFGAMIGQGAADVLDSWWDKAKEFFQTLKEIWDNFNGKDAIKTAQEIGSSAIDAGISGVKNFFHMGEDTSVSKPKESPDITDFDAVQKPRHFGYVSNVPDVPVASGTAKAATYINTIPEIAKNTNLIGSASDDSKSSKAMLGEDAAAVKESLLGSGDKETSMAAPVKTQNSQPKTESPKTTPPPININLDNNELLTESRKQTHLLERIARPGPSGRAGRDSSRP